jgi:UDP-N-acetylglucosamine acyltransferase
VIGHNSIIGEGCEIGARTRIMNNVELRKGTIVGEDCYVDSGVKSSGLNRVGDRVVLRYDAIIARGCDIGDDAYICPQVMTNNLNHLREEVGGAHVGRAAFIGTNATLAAGITIADEVVVGSKAFVSRDCPVEGGVYIGMPARLRE